MRKLMTIFIMLVFLVQTFSQVGILLSFYLNQDYISKNLCINRFEAIPICKGSCVLEKKLADNEKKEQTGTAIKNSEWQVVLFDQEQPLSFFNPDLVIKLNFGCYPENILSGYHHSIFHPPISIS